MVGPPTGTQSVLGAVASLALVVLVVVVASYPLFALVGASAGLTALVGRGLLRRRRRRGRRRTGGTEPDASARRSELAD